MGPSRTYWPLKNLALFIGLLPISLALMGCGILPAAAPPSPNNENTVLLTAYGATCDGQHNDQLALQAALNEVSSKGGGVVVVPPATCRILQTESAPWTNLTGPVTIRGASSLSTLSLDSDQPSAYRELFRISGTDPSLQGVRLVRAGDTYGVMVNIGASTNLSFDSVVIDGKKDVYGARVFHGISLGGSSGELIKDVSMVNSTIENVDFGLFQASNIRSTMDGFRVDSSTFIRNHADDLELNAPEGAITHISVTRSRFLDNKKPADSFGSGFGVGLANVQHVLIEKNTFKGYRYEPIHIEDRSGFVTIRDNSFSDSFTVPVNWASHVLVIGSSHDITITSNAFDTTANKNSIDCVYLGAGGGLTAPDRVWVTGNTFKLRPSAEVIAVYGATNVTTSSNVTTPAS